MELTFPRDAEDFRAEIRAWLEQNLPAGWFEPGFELSDDARRRFNVEWPAKLFEGGWRIVHHHAEQLQEDGAVQSSPVHLDGKEPA